MRRVFSRAAAFRSSRVRTTKWPFSVLVPLDEILPLHPLAFLLAHAFEIDRRAIPGVEHPEAGTAVPHGGVNLDRDIDEAKRQRARPDGSSHVRASRNSSATFATAELGETLITFAVLTVFT